MLSELLFSLLGSFFFNLRGNTHISKNLLRILLLGATLSTKIFHEYGPWTVVIINSDRLATILQRSSSLTSLSHHRLLNLVPMKTNYNRSRLPSLLWLRARCALSSSGGDDRTCSPITSNSISEKNTVGRGPSTDSGRPIILILLRRLRPSKSDVLALSLV